MYEKNLSGTHLHWTKQGKSRGLCQPKQQGAQEELLPNLLLFYDVLLLLSAHAESFC